MFEKPKLGLNDEELDDYRDFDDEHTERGSKLDEFGAVTHDDHARLRRARPLASCQQLLPGAVESGVFKWFYQVIHHVKIVGTSAEIRVR